VTTYNPRVRGPFEAVDGVAAGSDLRGSQEGLDSERGSVVGPVGTILELGGNALGVLGNVLQGTAASQRSRSETAAEGNFGAPPSLLADQAIQVVQTVYERLSHDKTPNPGTYQRRWRAKE